VLRCEFGPDSDVDVLVEFAPGRVPGFITFATMEHELTGLVRRRVELHTITSISRFFRDEVRARAKVFSIVPWTTRRPPDQSSDPPVPTRKG